MDDHLVSMPGSIAGIRRDSEAIGFSMASEPRTGSLLAVLAASKPGGRLLELGTGTGVGAAWILAGMDADARLDTVDTDPSVVAVAQRHLAADARVTFHVTDAVEFLRRSPRPTFDLVYADAWPGKFTNLEDALDLLRPGGLYVIDDLLPVEGWPSGHQDKVSSLLGQLERHRGLRVVRMTWASGLVIGVRTADG